jgi:hypothetical protein
MASTLAAKPAPVAHTALTREAANAGHLRHYEKTGKLDTVAVLVTAGRCSCTNVRSRGLREGRKHVTGKEESV